MSLLLDASTFWPLYRCNLIALDSFGTNGVVIKEVIYYLR